ncbi:hypothetical protein FQN57_002891 [Myotisia sp. PD_48]|nr:hypothetical protein FQN57_002891 [Myotisia sp. PD_48]
MTTAQKKNVGDFALSGEWEWVPNKCFEIKEDMVMEFRGRECTIADSENNLIPGGKLGPEHGEVTTDVKPGYRCYVTKSWVKFEKEEIDEGKY